MPGAVLGSVLSIFILHIALLILYYVIGWAVLSVFGSPTQIELPRSEGIIKYVKPVEIYLTPIVMAWGFVSWGVMIAPKKEFIVSVTLTLFLFVFLGSLLFYAQNSDYLLIEYSFYGISRLAFTILAGVGICIQTYKEYSEKQREDKVC